MGKYPIVKNTSRLKLRLVREMHGGRMGGQLKTFAVWYQQITDFPQKRMCSMDKLHPSKDTYKKQKKRKKEKRRNQ